MGRSFPIGRYFPEPYLLQYLFDYFAILQFCGLCRLKQKVDKYFVIDNTSSKRHLIRYINTPLCIFYGRLFTFSFSVTLRGWLQQSFSKTIGTKFILSTNAYICMYVYLLTN